VGNNVPGGGGGWGGGCGGGGNAGDARCEASNVRRALRGGGTSTKKKNTEVTYSAIQYPNRKEKKIIKNLKRTLWDRTTQIADGKAKQVNKKHHKNHQWIDQNRHARPNVREGGEHSRLLKLTKREVDLPVRIVARQD